MRLSHVLALGLCLLGTASLAQAQNGRPTLAVLPVKSEAKPAPRALGAVSLETLRDRIEGLLIKTQKLTLVDRQRLTKILDEIGLGELGLTDPAATVKAGKVLGADYLLEARLIEWSLEESQRQIPISNRWQRTRRLTCALSLRVVDARTGKVAINERVGASQTWKQESAQSFQSDALSSEEQGAVQDLALARLRDQILVAFPMKVVSIDAGGTVFLSYGSGTGILRGQVCAVMGEGSELRDPDTGEVLGKTDREVARLEVIAVEERFCRAKVISGDAYAIQAGARCQVIRERPEDWPRPEEGRK